MGVFTGEERDLYPKTVFFYWNIYTGKLTVSVQLHLQEISRRQTKAAIDKTQL